MNPGPDNGRLLGPADMPLAGEIHINADGQVGLVEPVGVGARASASIHRSQPAPTRVHDTRRSGGRSWRRAVERPSRSHRPDADSVFARSEPRRQRRCAAHASPTRNVTTGPDRQRPRPARPTAGSPDLPGERHGRPRLLAARGRDLLRRTGCDGHAGLLHDPRGRLDGLGPERSSSGRRRKGRVRS